MENAPRTEGGPSLEKRAERYAAMPPELMNSLLEKRAEYSRERYAAMPPEQKEALLEQRAECNRKGMDAGTESFGGACAAGCLHSSLVSGDRWTARECSTVPGM